MELSTEQCTPPKTPDFIKSVFDEDSGLGMDSPTFSLFNMTNSHKRKRSETNDSPVSYSKKRVINCRQRKSLKKSLSFEVQTQFTKFDKADSESGINRVDISNDILKTDDTLVTGSVLTGDGSKECCLPTVQGRFHDLCYITPATMTDVLNGKYDHVINSYRIIDNRYTYEFDGGHIKGAENFHNKDDILRFFDSPKNSSNCDDGKRDIIIFHCEFSLERGPKMCRHLRNYDREINAENYSALYYPEIYILKGGYKEFYENYKSLCTPMNYVPMMSKDHKNDLRHFRSKSKSWYAGQKRLKSGSVNLF